ncbi:hypothetical protein Peur_065134 [Populus x canadensis]
MSSKRPPSWQVIVSDFVVSSVAPTLLYLLQGNTGLGNSAHFWSLPYYYGKRKVLFYFIIIVFKRLIRWGGA